MPKKQDFNQVLAQAIADGDLKKVKVACWGNERASLHHRDANKNAPLHLAVLQARAQPSNNRRKIVAHLLKKGAGEQVDKNEDDNTAMHLALMGERFDSKLFDLLKKKRYLGSKAWKVKNKAGQKPEDLLYIFLGQALDQGNWVLAKQLIKAGATVYCYGVIEELEDVVVDTALHRAVRFVNAHPSKAGMDMVRSLVKKDPDMLDACAGPDTKTPYDSIKNKPKQNPLLLAYLKERDYGSSSEEQESASAGSGESDTSSGSDDDVPQPPIHRDVKPVVAPVPLHPEPTIGQQPSRRDVTPFSANVVPSLVHERGGASAQVREHSARRIDLYFYLLIAYYRTGLKVELAPTRRQHGVATAGLQAAHSTIVSATEDGTAGAAARLGRHAPRGSILDGTHFFESLNMTTEVRPAVNYLDRQLEGTTRAHPGVVRECALSILNEVSRGEISPIVGLHKFVLKLLEFLENAKKLDQWAKKNTKTAPAAARADAQREERAGIEGKVLEGQLNMAYVHSLLRLRPEEIDRCHQGGARAAEVYDAAFTRLQKEILSAGAAGDDPLHATQVYAEKRIGISWAEIFKGDDDYELRCPISQELMDDPVIARDGYTYEKRNILRWFEYHSRSPLTNLELPTLMLIPNRALAGIIEKVRAARPQGQVVLDEEEGFPGKAVTMRASVAAAHAAAGGAPSFDCGGGGGGGGGGGEYPLSRNPAAFLRGQRRPRDESDLFPAKRRMPPDDFPKEGRGGPRW